MRILINFINYIRKYRTFPYNGCLANGLQSTVCGLGEGIESLLQCFPRRFQVCLGLGILRITIDVKLIAACAEQCRWKGLCNRCDERGSKVGGSSRGKAELACRWFVGE